MLMARRARRMQRRRERSAHAEKLTLVSMVDILTVLVTFLLATSVSGHHPPMPGHLVLPQSSARTQPKYQNRVMITRDKIMVGNTTVVATAKVLASDQGTIPALAAALQQQAPAQHAQATAKQPANGRGTMTVMADKGLPYRLIKKVMLTCAQAGFQKISLAVLKGEGHV